MVRDVSASLWACPACHRVQPQLFRIRYGLGLVDVGPIVRCATCVDELRALEREHAEGRSLDRAVWGLEILETIGAVEAVAVAAPIEHVSRRAKTHAPAPKRHALGGVGV